LLVGDSNTIHTLLSNAEGSEILELYLHKETKSGSWLEYQFLATSLALYGPYTFTYVTSSTYRCFGCAWGNRKSSKERDILPLLQQGADWGGLDAEKLQEARNESAHESFKQTLLLIYYRKLHHRYGRITILEVLHRMKPYQLPAP
jgi:hypothetical protein